jgi:hypothetical protein
MKTLTTKQILFRLLEIEDEDVTKWGVIALAKLAEDMHNDNLHPAWRWITQQ